MSPIYVPGKVTLAKEFTWNETVWNPSMLSTALWLDAADASTITESGGAVSQWDDKSGNNRDVSQATTSAQPLLISNALNQLPLLRFDGSNDYLFNASPGLNGLSTVTILGVFKLLATPVNEDVLAGIGSTGQLRAVRSIWRAANQANVGTLGWGANVLDSGLSYDTPNPHIFGMYNTGLNIPNNTVVVKDGTISVNTVFENVSYLTTADGFSVGSLQGSSVNNYYANMECGEIVVLGTAPSTDTRQRIEGYLAHKWGLTANLPSDHPYKLVGPTP
jgi:hypothetical protein